MEIPLKLFDAFSVATPVREGMSWYFLAFRKDQDDADGNSRSTSTIFPLIDDGVHALQRFGYLDIVE